MRRVLVVAEWINLTGGVTRTLLELLKRMDPADFDVTLYVMRPDESELSAVPRHVKVVENTFDLPYLGPRQVLKRLLRERKVFSALSYIATAARWKLRPSRAAYARFFANRHPRPSGTFDLVLAYAMLDSYSNQYVAERAEAPRKIMWCHTDAALYSDRGLSGLESVFTQFDVINCVSKETERGLSRRFPGLDGRTRVRHNLMDAEQIIRLSTESAPCSSPPGVTVLTTVARISHEKGIDLLVDAAALLKEAGHRFLWWVVGPDFDPAFSAEVKARCANAGLNDQVRFVGAQDNPYIYMSACDIYVQTSRIEGFCTTTAEAKILNKPVVCTDTAGADEQFQHGINGSVVAATADDLFVEIERLIDSPEVRESYQETLRACAPTVGATVASLLD